MRKTLLAGPALSIAFFFLVFAGVAYARSGESTYQPVVPLNSPHGNYTTASTKCAVCHAVHHAGRLGNGVGSEALLRDTRANGCMYCHLDNGVAQKKVYDGKTANYAGTDFKNAHNDLGENGGVTCYGCHQVHGAPSDMTDNALLSAYLLAKPPGGYDPDNSSGAPGDDGQPLATDLDYNVALTKWCTGCHQYTPGSPLLDWGHDSHPVGPAATADGISSYGGGSQYCSSCHSSTTVGGLASTSNFPHYTDGVRFLERSADDSGGALGAQPAADSEMDGICFRCHRDGAGNGVGKSF